MLNSIKNNVVLEGYSDNMPFRDLGWLMYTDARGSRRTWWLPPWSRGYSKLPFFHRLLSSFFTYICRVFLKFEFAALDSDDLLYLKEQMEAEEDAERLLRRTEKRAFAAFKISLFNFQQLFIIDINNTIIYAFPFASSSIRNLSKFFKIFDLALRLITLPISKTVKVLNVRNSNVLNLICMIDYLIRKKKWKVHCYLLHFSPLDS